MSLLRNVLCPIDFSDLSRKELALAAEVCAAFGARLLLHHNIAGVQPGVTRAWEWNEVHRDDGSSSSISAESQLRALIKEIKGPVAVEASISSGPLGVVLLELANALPADLLVLGSHGWSTADHASVTERLIDRSPCPVLTLHEGVNAEGFRLRDPQGNGVAVVVPTDLSDSAQKAVAYAFEMARFLPLQVHLLHVLPGGASVQQLEKAQEALAASTPEDIPAIQVHEHVETGDPTARIIEVSQRLGAAFIVMGEHARSFFRRVFTHDTARDVLHRAPCPVWFVPVRG